MARDRFDREIDYLRLSVTAKCNLGCVYCRPGGARNVEEPARVEPVTVAEAVRIVRAAKELGVLKVRLTGGEPLMRPDIVELVSAIAAEGIADLSLTTNGQMLSALAPALKSAGLRRLNVSLDSLDADNYRSITGGGELERTLEGIRAAEEARLNPVKINMVPVRGINHGEIPAFARMTLDKPVHIRFIEYMPAVGKGEWELEKCVTSDEVKSIIEKELGPMVKREFKGKGPSRNYVLDGAQGIVGFISAVSHSFCYRCNRLRLTSQGRLRACLFSDSEIDLLGPMRQGADDNELLRLLKLSVMTKPEGNYLTEPGRATRIQMSRIGG